MNSWKARRPRVLSPRATRWSLHRSYQPNYAVASYPGCSINRIANVPMTQLSTDRTDRRPICARQLSSRYITMYAVRIMRLRYRCARRIITTMGELGVAPFQPRPRTRRFARRRDTARQIVFIATPIIYEPDPRRADATLFCSFNPRCLSVFFRGISLPLPSAAISAEHAICHLSLGSARRRERKKRVATIQFGRER